MATIDSKERDVAELCVNGRHDLAAVRALELHGGEIMRFLVSRSGDPQLASDAFSLFSEDLCRGLPQFEFRSSVRTWVFSLAHRALARVRRSLARDTRSVPLSDSHTDSRLVAKNERTGTPVFVRTDVKQRLRALRDQLSDEDQLLLELRITRRFSWKDIARIQLSLEESVSTPAIDKEAARLRKRFQLVTERLRDMAVAEGIVPDQFEP